MLVGAGVAVLNFIEIIVLQRLKNKRKTYETLLLSLSITDFLFGVWKIIGFVVDYVTERDYNGFLYVIYFYFTSTIFHLTWISISRFLAIWKPIQYKIQWTERRVNISIVLIWLLSLATVAIVLCIDVFINDVKVIVHKGTFLRNNCSKIPSPTVSYGNSSKFFKTGAGNVAFSSTMRTTLSLIIIIADVFFIFTTIAVISVMEQRKRNTGIKNKNLSSATKVEDKVSIVCLTITVSFIVFTTPFPIVYFITKRPNIYVTAILVANSGVNSLVYFFRGKLN